MEPRLRRSNTEVIVAGVCGGLAEYFGIDPVLVRLIFVLMTLTTGIGILVYPILWMVMPKAGLPRTGAPPFAPPQAGQRPNAALEQQRDQAAHEVFLREQAQPAMSRTAAASKAQYAPPPEAYNFDPLTGQPLRPGGPMTGRTVNLGGDPAQLPAAIPPADPNSPFTQQNNWSYAPATPRRRWRLLGLIVLGVGVMGLASQFGINLDFVFPLLMIGAGILLLRRR